MLHALPRASVVSEISPCAVKNLETQLDHSHTRGHVGLTTWRSAKPEKFGRLSRSHAPTYAACISGSFPRTATISLCVAHPLATRAVLSAMSTTRSTYERNMAFNRCCTPLHTPPGFLAFPPRVGEHCMLLPRIENCCWCHLTSPDDVITPR